MKKISIITLSILAFVTACGPTDKKTELAELKQKEKEISAKITQLESEIAASDTAAVAQSAEAFTAVEVANVSEKPFVHYVNVQGKIDSDNNILLGSKASGTITNVYVKEGEHVKKGEILAEIDSDILQASMVELQSSLELANTLYERQKNLWEQNIGTEVQYLQAKNRKESLEQKLASLNEQIQLTKIIAPFSGTVDAVLIKKGEVAGPGMPAVRIVNPSDFTLKAELSENYVNRIKIGDKVLIEIPTLTKKVESKIISVSNVIDPVNRTFSIEVSIPDSLNDHIKANMITNIHIQDYKNENAVVIPINAISFSDNGEFVFLAKGNTAKRQEVKTGKSYNNQMEIVEGLKAGDQIIVTGQKSITDGQSITY